MGERQPGKAGRITDLVVLGLLVGTAMASGCLWYLGNWEEHGWALTLTLRILWGSWIVACLATILTKVTIFGWSFRQYFRWQGEGRPPWARFRPSRAPWSKDGKASFSITVAMVSLTGLVAVATVVMWILRDVTGDWVFRLVFYILWGSWWVLVITLVLVRVAIFGWQKHKAMAERNRAEAQPELSASEKSESNA
jgi:hypothetical protein